MYDYPDWRVTAGVILLATLSPDLEASPGFTRVTPSRIQEESVLTRDELANMSYEGIYDESFRLTDGVYEGEPFVEGAASRPRVELVGDFLLTGDLDGDGGKEAVVLLSESSGGSGTNLYLAVVGRREGRPAHLATARIGDRVQVRMASLTGERIELDVIQAGPEDTACCPSQKAIRTWMWSGSGLKESKPRITGKLSLADLMGPVWILTRIASEEEVPLEPEITLIFEGERITGIGGCNRYFAQIEGRAAGEMSVGPIGSTRRACPEPVMELEGRYFEALGGAVNYRFFVGKLAIAYQIRGVYHTMLFEPREESSAEANK